MGQKIFTHTHRVTFAECTVGNHVYYARYLDILEEARGEFLRTLGMPYLEMQQQGTHFPVIEVQVKYKGAARYDDVLTVEVQVLEVRGVRMKLGYRVTSQTSKPILEGTVTHACTDAVETLKRIPEVVEGMLRDYVVKS